MKNIHTYYLINAIPIILKIAEKEGIDYKINIDKFRKLLNLKRKKDVIDLINRLCLITTNAIGDPDYYFNIIYEENSPKDEEEIYIISNHIVEMLKNLSFPLNYEEWEILKKDFENNKILNKLSSKISSLLIEDTEKMIIEEIKNTIQNSINENKGIIFLYKKANSQNVEEKKVLPLLLLETKYSDYLFGYDFQKKEKRLYRLDRMIKILNYFHFFQKMDITTEEKKLLKNFERNDGKKIKIFEFAYMPEIEINLKNRIDFTPTDKTITIHDSLWKIGTFKTFYMPNLLENIIPFAGFVYFLQPQEINQKILEYFYKIYQRY